LKSIGLLAEIGLLAKPIARIRVRAARPPRGAAFFSGDGSPPPPLVARRLRRVPEFAAAEPLHRHVGVRALQLTQGGQQVLGQLRAERGRAVVDQDGPVREARRH